MLYHPFEIRMRYACLLLLCQDKMENERTEVLFFPRSRNGIVEQNINKIFFLSTKVFSGHVSRKGSLLHTITSD